MSAADHHAPNHDYHLVDPSPWPALGALSGFVFTFGLVVFMADLFDRPERFDVLGPGLQAVQQFVRERAGAKGAAA